MPEYCVCLSICPAPLLVLSLLSLTDKTCFHSFSYLKIVSLEDERKGKGKEGKQRGEREGRKGKGREEKRKEGRKKDKGREEEGEGEKKGRGGKKEKRKGGGGKGRRE